MFLIIFGIHYDAILILIDFISASYIAKQYFPSGVGVSCSDKKILVI
jgi:hypothetical protein